MTLLGSVLVQRMRGLAKKISWKAIPCLEKWVTMALNMSDKILFLLMLTLNFLVYFIIWTADQV